MPSADSALRVEEAVTVDESAAVTRFHSPSSRRPSSTLLQSAIRNARSAVAARAGLLHF
jgi:hypothetical protein